MAYYRFKILIAGDGAVGKTSIVQRYIKRKFYKKYEATVSVDIFTKNITNKDGDEISLVVWDVAGQDQYEFLRGNFYDGSDGILLVFDLTRVETFDHLDKWVEDIKTQLGDKVPYILIGNKVDLIEDVGTVIDHDDITAYAEKKHLVYREVSAKTGLNVEIVFEDLARKIVREKTHKVNMFTSLWKRAHNIK